MGTLGSSGPRACKFDSDKLVLHVDLLVASKIEAVSPVVDDLMRLLKKTCCAPEQEFAVETALREALANAVLHGNHQDARKKVRVCCACQVDRGILIIVKDEGRGFDPVNLPNPLVGENLHSEHGRGIYLINLLMDHVRFRRGGTEIHMRKGGSPAQSGDKGLRASNTAHAVSEDNHLECPGTRQKPGDQPESFS
jgi:serine/threonine-protein kinase RsbW